MAKRRTSKEEMRMKCRYDLTKQCTVDCKKIRTCAWMNRRKRLAAGSERKAAAPAGEEQDNEIDRNSRKNLAFKQK